MKRQRLHSILLGLMVLMVLYGCESNSGGDSSNSFNSTASPQLIIYSTGVFGDTSIPVNDQKGKYLDQLSSAGYATLIEASFHVYPGGKIVLNGADTWLVDENGNVNQHMLYLKDIHDELKRRGIRIFASIGGGGGCCSCAQNNTLDSPPQSNWDYSRVMEFYKANGTNHQFFKNLLILNSVFGIDGIDLNYEPKETMCQGQSNPYAGYDADFTNLLVVLIKYLKNNDMSVIATPWRGPIPLRHEDFWPNVIRQTLTESGPMLDWLQVQQYSGSDSLSDWQTVAENAGVKDALGFLSAGYSCSRDSCNISSINGLTDDVKNSPSGLNKYFLWQYKAMIGYGGDNNCDNTAAEYANAIRKGFSRKPK